MASITERFAIQTSSRRDSEKLSTCVCACNFESQSAESDSGSPVTVRKPPSYALEDPYGTEVLRPEVLAEIDSTIDELDSELRQLSLDIWGKRWSEEDTATF